MAKASSDALPWYRKRTYGGKMSEVEKRLLDDIRREGKHPAPTYSDLPREAQNYISNLELSLYDSKQQRLAGACFLTTAIGVYLLYTGYQSAENARLMVGVAASVLPWPYYWYAWKKMLDLSCLMTILIGMQTRRCSRSGT